MQSRRHANPVDHGRSIKPHSGSSMLFMAAAVIASFSGVAQAQVDNAMCCNTVVSNYAMYTPSGVEYSGCSAFNK